MIYSVIAILIRFDLLTLPIVVESLLRSSNCFSGSFKFNSCNGVPHIYANIPGVKGYDPVNLMQHASSLPYAKGPDGTVNIDLRGATI